MGRRLIRRRTQLKVLWLTFCRTFRLTVLASNWLPADEPEHPKIALRQDRTVAAIRAAVHLVPLGGAIVVVALNLMGYYYGDANAWVSILQFVAKAHEMLMQVSIAFEVWSFMRRTPMSQHQVPFGALFAGPQVSDICYLWSAEFWASMTSECLYGRRKLAFAMLVPCSVMLASAVGPSSAIAMIPRQTNFLGGWTDILLNVSDSNLFPANVNADKVNSSCSTEGLPGIDYFQPCPARRWQSLQPWIREVTNVETTVPTVPSALQLIDVDLPASMYLWCGGDGEYQRAHGVVIATTVYLPIVYYANLAARSLDGTLAAGVPAFEGRSAIHSVEVTQPYVPASCTSFQVGNSTTNRVPFKTWSQNALSEDDLQPSHIPVTHADVWASADPAATSQIVWIGTEHYDVENTSIAAVVLYNISCGASCVFASSCITRAVWGQGSFNVSISDLQGLGNIDGSSFPSPWDDIFLWPTSTITISKEWAAFLTPHIYGQNTTVAEALIDSSPAAFDRAYTAENLLAALICNGLAQLVWPDVVDVKGLLARDGDPEPSRRSLNATWTSQNHFMFTLTSRLPGLAYTMDDFPIGIAVSVLLIYCMYALSHLVYTIYSGVSSNAWDSIPELVALAVNSSPSKELLNTSAGIERLDTFRRSVNVRALNDHLEIVFDDTGQTGNVGFKMVERNKKYS